MKKFLVLLSLFIFIFSLTACSKNKSPEQIQKELNELDSVNVSDYALYMNGAYEISTDEDKDKYLSWSLDFDGDGIENRYEKKYGTNIYDNDTDKDGISDGDEVNKTKTDPTKWSSRNDKQSDLDWFVSQKNENFKEGYDKRNISGFNVYIKEPKDRMYVISKVSTNIFDNLITITEPYQIKHFNGKIALNLSSFDESVMKSTAVYKESNGKSIKIKSEIEDKMLVFNISDNDIFVVVYEQ